MRDDVFVRAMLYHIRDDDNACTILAIAIVIILMKAMSLGWN